MGTLDMRRPLPDRRNSWTQKVRIGGQVVYLTVGEYEDGTPGEIWLDMAKAGTTMRGILGTLARTVSIALQCGADIKTVASMLRGHNYDPKGPVQGSSVVTECQSIADWIASELEAEYLEESERTQEDEVVETIRMSDCLDISA